MRYNGGEDMTAEELPMRRRMRRPGRCTFDDFLVLSPEDQKADLLDGVIYISPPDYPDHNDLLGWLLAVLGNFIDGRQLGQLTVSRVAYRLSNNTAPEPDLAFVRANRLGIERRNCMDGSPDLAIEIVAPDSVERDYEDKRRCYEEAGVEEYWIIDPDEKRAKFLVRGRQGFVEKRLKGNMFHSQVLPGLALDVRWLWQRPLPATRPIVQKLLESTGGK